jgi:hypothetical protein
VAERGEENSEGCQSPFTVMCTNYRHEPDEGHGKHELSREAGFMNGRNEKEHIRQLMITCDHDTIGYAGFCS